MLFPQYY